MPDLTLSSAMDAFLAEADPADVFLPLAGGTMDDNATILWDNASAIREAGAQGLEIECSVGYRWQWVAGRMILRMINSGQIARIIAIDEINPAATDDETQGFVVGTRWETVDGTIYICADATTGAAIWSAVYHHYDLSGYSSIDWNNRQLIANDGSTVMLDWSSSTAGVALTYGIPLNVDIIFDAGSPSNYIDMVNGEIGIGGYAGSYTPSIDWANRQLIGADGSTVAAGWSNGYIDAGANQICASSLKYASASTTIDLVNATLVNGFVPSLDWFQSILYATTDGITNSQSIDWSQRQLVNSNGIAVSWEYYSMNDNFNAQSIDWASRELIADDGTTVMLDWHNPYGNIEVFASIQMMGSGGDGFIIDPWGNPSIYVGDRYLYGSTGSDKSIDWGYRQLIASDGTTIMLDWSNATGKLTGGIVSFADVHAGSGGFHGVAYTDAAGTGAASFPYGAKLVPNTVASLVGDEGTIAYVNDADTPVIGSAVVGGGSAKCLVCYNGTNWIITSLL